MNDTTGAKAQTTDHALEIVINGRKKTVSDKGPTFNEVVALAFDPPPRDPTWSSRSRTGAGTGTSPKGSWSRVRR